MSKIIVSYRRSDSAATAGRIFDRLVDRYGDASVFMDIDRIPFGIDFRHHIQDALRDADILLAVVGPGWLGKKADGPSRIQDEADPVRVEIEAALRQSLTVIPVLVDSATMPTAAELPESIRDFAYINAAPIDIGRDFRAHMDRLTRSIDANLTSRQRDAEQTAPTAAGNGSTTGRPMRRRIMWALAVLVVLVIGGLALTPGLFDPTPPKKRSGDDIIIAAKQEPQPSAEAGEQPAVVTRPEPPLPVPTAPAPQTANATYRVLPNVSGGVQNLRGGPAVKYPVVVAIPAGATGIAIGACFPAEDNTRPWCAATWQDHSGYISSCCIVNERTGAPPRVD
jgi:TIR domain